MDLQQTCRALTADGKGLLAADETVPVLTERLLAATIESTPGVRRAYRELLFTTPGLEQYVSGVIMHDESIHQWNSKGVSLVRALDQRGIMTGIKVDTGLQPLAGSPGETVTQGLDGLRERLREYRELGARFASWRAAFAVNSTLPSRACVHANAHALARYAAICQEQGLVPIVEPQVLVEGTHTLARSEAVANTVLHALFESLDEQHVVLDAVVLRTAMVTPGDECPRRVTVTEVAEATLRSLRRNVPAAVTGVVFLSGGQDHVTATMHLNAINQVEGSKPWRLTFSFGRALQDEAIQIWRGKADNVANAQRAFQHRAQCVTAAARGQYALSMESAAAVA